MKQRMGSPLEKFERKYIRKSLNECWLWIGAKSSWGYGNMRYEGRPSPAHRLSFTFYKGNIPKGMIVCHRCDVPACVNPHHLFLGTHQDNTNDKIKKGRQPPKTGEKNPRVKLRERDVKYIRERYVPRHYKFSAVKLGKMFGVNATTICSAANGPNWKHLGVHK